VKTETKVLLGLSFMVILSFFLLYFIGIDCGSGIFDKIVLALSLFFLFLGLFPLVVIWAAISVFLDFGNFYYIFAGLGIIIASLLEFFYVRWLIRNISEFMENSVTKRVLLSIVLVVIAIFSLMILLLIFSITDKLCL
jgi:hypothetical protein